MAHAGIHHLGVTRGGPVASAIGWRAKEGTALHDLARNANGGLKGIEGSLHARPARIFGNAAGAFRIGGVLRAPPIHGPFPDIAANLMKPVAIGREALHRAGAGEAIGFEIAPRKGALPGIGQVHTTRRQFITPSEFSIFKPTARGKFPFRFRGQCLAGPGGVSGGVFKADMHHGVIFPPADITARPFRRAPMGALGPMPPMADIARIHRAICHAEHKRAGHQHIGGRTRIKRRVKRAFGNSLMASGRDKTSEILVRHRGLVHPKTLHRHIVAGPFFGIMPIRTHQEGAACDPGHGRAFTPLPGPVGAVHHANDPLLKRIHLA